jgi:Tfp pilus assembly protein PilO
MRIQPRERKLIIAGGVAALLFLLVQYVVLPVWERRSTGPDDLAAAQKELRRQRELIAALKPVQNQAGLLEARLTTVERRLLPDQAPSKAGADLQAWVSQRATQQQIDVVRSEFLPPTQSADRYVRVPVQFELNGQITQIMQLFEGMLRSDRLISLEDMQINSAGAKDKRVRCTVVIATLMAKGK